MLLGLFEIEDPEISGNVLAPVMFEFANSKPRQVTKGVSRDDTPGPANHGQYRYV